MRTVEKHGTVVFNSVSAKSGGAATYIGNLAHEVRSWAQHCIFFVPPQAAKTLRDVGADIEVIETNIGNKSAWRRFLWDQMVLRRNLKQRKADLLISTSDFGMLFPPCKQILMIRNPLFFSDLYATAILPQKTWRFRVDFWLRRLLIGLSARFSTVVLTASRSMLEDVKKYFA